MNIRLPDSKNFVQKFEFSDRDFASIAKLAHRQFGLFLPERKKSLVYSRLARRLRALNLTGFKEYCALLASDECLEERQNLLSALTTNVTHFYREEHHFKSLSDLAYRRLIEKAKAGGKVRIWSAGCSAGHEPFSIAFSLLSCCPEISDLDVKILATDIDTRILDRAKRGRYSGEEIAPLPTTFRSRFLQESGGEFEVVDEAKRLVRFGALNLIDEWPVKGPFDVIMCRNVAIYFDKPTQSKLWNRFAEILEKDGHLYIGHSERLSGPALEKLTSIGVTAYQKTCG